MMGEYSRKAGEVKDIGSLENGAATGAVLDLLRMEGLAMFIAAIFAYGEGGASWWMFAALFLAPDVSFVGYVLDPRRGALIYNTVHTYVTPLVLAAAGFAFGYPVAVQVALIWIAHIGADRALGFGLTYASGFKDTHLGQVGITASRT